MESNKLEVKPSAYNYDDDFENFPLNLKEKEIKGDVTNETEMYNHTAIIESKPLDKKTAKVQRVMTIISLIILCSGCLTTFIVFAAKREIIYLYKFFFFPQIAKELQPNIYCFFTIWGLVICNNHLDFRCFVLYDF